MKIEEQPEEVAEEVDVADVAAPEATADIYNCVAFWFEEEIYPYHLLKDDDVIVAMRCFCQEINEPLESFRFFLFGYLITNFHCKLKDEDLLQPNYTCISVFSHTD